jgi:hypothetical protein
MVTSRAASSGPVTPTRLGSGPLLVGGDGDGTKGAIGRVKQRGRDAVAADAVSAAQDRVLVGAHLGQLRRSGRMLAADPPRLTGWDHAWPIVCWQQPLVLSR